MFLELVDGDFFFFFLTNFIKRRENWFWVLKQKNAHNFLFYKKLKLLPFTVTYVPLLSLFGDNLLASWYKHCVRLPILQLSPVTTSPALPYRSMLQMLKHCFDNNKTLTLHILFLSFFLSFLLTLFGYSLIRTLDNVTNYSTCSQRKRV